MKNNIVSHNLTNNSLVIVYSNDKGFNTKIVESSHPNWRQVLAAYKQGNYDEVIDLIDVKTAINKKFDGKFTIVGETVQYNGETVNGYLFDRIIFFMRNNLPFERLVKFADNLYQNPSNRARQELYKFLEHKNMPITEDGCFLAYKGVQNDFWSITGGTIKVLKGKVNDEGQIYNGVGEEIIVDRGDVDDNCNNTCSKGIHAGSVSYATDFAGKGKIVVVKINPKDCVSVPTDCNGQKLRTCAYTVIGEEYRSLSDVRDINYDKGEEFHSDDEEVGWEQGYEDGIHDAELGRDCQPYSSIEDYVDGYHEGWNETMSGCSSDESDEGCCGDCGCKVEEAEMVEQPKEQVRDNNFINGFNEGYEEGYDDGYGDGINENNPIIVGKPKVAKVKPVKKQVLKRDKSGRFCS
jgi:hypothetical protein